MAPNSVEWESATLGELGQFRNGVNFSQADYGLGVPIINVKQLYGGRYAQTRELLELRPSAVRNAELVQLKSGDILFARSSVKASGAGQVAMVGGCPRGTVFSGFIIRFRVEASDRAAPSFLNYVLRSPTYRELLTRIGSGTTITNLSQETLAGIEVDLPPLPEQRAIAHILGTLDDKIELNRRMNATLEAMARALFKSWFVDFDPVRAKAERRDPGLPKPLADLFPARLVDSELGEIPEGWEVGRFGDVVEQLRDQENPLSFPDVLFHHFSIPAFDEGQTAKAEFGESIKSLKSRVPPGVILMSKLNPEIERVWMVDVRPGDRAVCSTEFLVLRARPPFTRSYAYCLARSPLFRQQIEGLVTGTSKSHQRAQVESILNLAAVKPSARVVAAFDRSTDGILARTLECRREGRTLAALRDALLPKLVSGKIRVKDAEKLIGRVS